MSNLQVVEICAGAGGQALGLERAGFDHALAIELDVNASATLSANRNWKVATGDVAKVDVWKPADYEGVDLLAGGVPCPPFSIAGKQLGAQDERDLFAWAVETTAIVQPRALMLENVRGLAAARFAAYRQHVLDRLADLGYIADWRLLHAADYGVPQLRPRFVLVAMKPEDAAYFHWPAATPTTETVGSTLVDLMAVRGWPGADRWASGASQIAPTIVGGSKKHGGADLGPTRAKRAWAELGVDGLGVADSPPSETHPVDYRPKLTVEMVARLQGWQDDWGWQFVGGKTSRYRQVGNAFPPPVAQAIGERIVKALGHEGKAVEPIVRVHDGVYRVLRQAHDYLPAEKIIADSGERLDVPQLERRLAHLSSDFHIDVQTTISGPRYRLMGFRAFVGQDDHRRHEYVLKNRAKVS